MTWSMFFFSTTYLANCTFLGDINSAKKKGQHCMNKSHFVSDFVLWETNKTKNQGEDWLYKKDLAHESRRKRRKKYKKTWEQIFEGDNKTIGPCKESSREYALSVESSKKAREEEVSWYTIVYPPGYLNVFWLASLIHFSSDHMWSKLGKC